jgi:hypothetical protein
METLIMGWTEDETQKCSIVSTMRIMAKSKMLLAMVKGKAISEYSGEFTSMLQ